MKLAVFLFLIAFLFEATIITIPLVFICLLVFSLMNKNPWMFGLYFLSGIFLDISSLRNLGETSLFFIGFFFLVLLYERKFEIATFPFIFISSFLGSFLFMNVFGFSFYFFGAILSSIIAVFAVFILQLYNTETKDKRFNLVR